MKKEVIEAKAALDSIVKKGRIHLYKPIQVAEVLYYYRTTDEVNLDNAESYRKKSKHWRDAVTIELLGRKCSSSAKYQDDVFNADAVPPKYIKVLAEENKRLGGAIESYIYNRFLKKQTQLKTALDMAGNATKADFNVEAFINSFWAQPGLNAVLIKYMKLLYSHCSLL